MSATFDQFSLDALVQEFCDAPETFPAGELNWLAFCYVNSELSEVAETQFEAALGTSECACQAVADVVRTSSSLATVFAEDSVAHNEPVHNGPASHNSPEHQLVNSTAGAGAIRQTLAVATKPVMTKPAGNSLRPAQSSKTAWISIALSAAVCAAFFIGVMQFSLPVTAQADSGLAMNWADTLPDEFNDFEYGSELNLPETEINDSVLMSSLYASDLDDAVPEWILAAVTPDPADDGGAVGSPQIHVEPVEN